MKRIAVVTSSRAEYGLLSPLIKRIYEADDFLLDLIVTGSHLSDKYGHTVDEIKKDGFDISHEIPILDEDNTEYGISIPVIILIRLRAAPDGYLVGITRISAIPSQALFMAEMA